MRIGINLSAIDIIMDISCTGILMTFKKPRLFSRPSVRSFGVVVNVISDEPIMRNTSLTAIAVAM